MSSALYATRLVWDGRQGIAKLHFKLIVLEATPWLPGVPFESVDYIPEIALYRIRPPRERERDMEGVEIAACDAFLYRIFKG